MRDHVPVLDKLLRARAERLAEHEAWLAGLDDDIERLSGIANDDVTVAAVDAVQNIPPILWTVPDLIHTAGCGVLASEPFVGKSLFLTHLAVCVAAGRPIFGRYCPLGPVPVLYLYAESSYNGFLVTLKQCMESLGAAPPNLYVNSLDARMSSVKVGRSGLESVIRRRGARLVILDTMSFFNLAKENDNDEMQRKFMEPVIDVCKRLNCFLLFAHHSGKGGADQKSIYRIRGATAISGAADVVMRLEWPDDTDGGPDRTLHLEKVRGARKESIDLWFDWGRKIITARDQDPNEILQPRRRVRDDSSEEWWLNGR